MPATALMRSTRCCRLPCRARLLLDAEKAAIENALTRFSVKAAGENIQKLNTAIDNATKKGNLAEVFAQEVAQPLLDISIYRQKQQTYLER